MKSTGGTERGEAGESTGPPAAGGVDNHGDCSHDDYAYGECDDGDHVYGDYGGHVLDGHQDVRDELAAIRGRAEAVRDEQVDRALSRLRANGELTPERRAAVERLADRLVARLLAAPAATLDATADGDDVDATSALALFRD